MMTDTVRHCHAPVRDIHGRHRDDPGATEHRARVLNTPGKRIAALSREVVADSAATIWLVYHQRPIAVGDTFTLPDGETLKVDRVERHALSLIQGAIIDAPPGPFDAATCILVLGLNPDDGAKLDTLKGVRSRMTAGAPFILVDQCIDRSAPDFGLRLDRYAAYARRSGVDSDTLDGAKAMISSLESMVAASRNEQLLDEAGFVDVEVFYAGMSWRGWIAYA